MSTQPNHTENLPRLNRISGQIDGIKKMIEENRYCTDIIVQIRAATAALKSVENAILNKHLHHCVAQSFESSAERDRAIEELTTLLTR